MSDYIPSNDAQYSIWLDRFVSFMTANLAEIGLTEGEITDLVTAFAAFQTAFMQFQDARTTYRMARDSKDDAREETEQLVRPLVGRIQSFVGTTNAHRQGLGIPVRGTSNTPTGVPALDSRPSAVIDIRPCLKHALRIHDETDSGARKGKPAGAMGCEVWYKVGTAPTTTEDMVYHGLWTKNPYLVEFKPEDALKPVYYRLRWINNKGEKGDWGEIDHATIAA